MRKKSAVIDYWEMCLNACYRSAHECVYCDKREGRKPTTRIYRRTDGDEYAPLTYT